MNALTPLDHPGGGEMLEFGIRFGQWAREVPGGLTPQRISDHWNVSRATAYRWLAAWRRTNRS